MKRSWIKRKSKKVDYWAKCRNELKDVFYDKGITRCELMLPGCFGDNFLGFAHRHKRVWYSKTPELLKDFNQVILACQNCHEKIEVNKELTENKFLKLRQ